MKVCPLRQAFCIYSCTKGLNIFFMEKREKFSSRLGFILVSAGCAIGLGNVYKFPYICGQYGGAAFILIYLAFLAVLGLPVLACEFAVGRGAGKGMAGAFEALQPKGTRWHWLKWISIAGCYLLMMFYTVVSGWMMYYAWKTAAGGLSGLDTEEISGVFAALTASPGKMTFWMVLTVLLAFGICSLGLKGGIERITKVMMTCLLLLIVLLAIHSLTLGGAKEGIRFYLIPNFSLVKENGIGNVVYAAMSQAFFTLSIGIGAMEIFGSYQSQEHTLLSEGINIVLLDTFVALMAGLITIPACFAYGIEPTSGFSLLFITLPNVFNHMALGNLWGTLFFIFMSFAALSTVIAVFEGILSFYMDRGWSRKKAVGLNIPLMIVLSLPALLGFNLLSGFQPLGTGTGIMDLEDFLVSSNLLPLGSLVFVLFCTRKNGWGWERFKKTVNTGKGAKIGETLRGYISYGVPAIIILVYLKGYYDFFKPRGTGYLIFWMCFAVALLGIILAVSLFGRKRENTD